MPAPAPLENLRWKRLRFTIRNVRVSHAVKSHPLSVIQSIVKNVAASVAPDENHRSGIFFLADNVTHKSTIRKRAEFAASVFFCGARSTFAESFHHRLREYFRDGDSANYELIDAIHPEDRSFAKLSDEHAPIKSEGEICLEFLTPLPTRLDKGKSRTYVSAPSFGAMIARRMEKLFGGSFALPDNHHEFNIFPYYWNYTEIHHQSKSQRGHTKFINGCVGKLYLKGRFDATAPLLLLGAELGCGTELQYGQGRFRIWNDSPGHFSVFFPNTTAIEACVEDTRERYDNPLDYLNESGGIPFEAREFSEKTAAQLKNETYEFTPSQAFEIKKKSGSTRLAERICFPDLVVQSYLLKTITRNFDRFFEEESIGFRKGKSRESAVAMVRKHIEDGYRCVIESDIEDFFPSVDHDTLQHLLCGYLPEKDRWIADLIMKSVKTGYILNGTFHPRLKGLAQGNPLSPILANLYLDSFDEEIKKLDVRLVRYADDFVILARSREQAEETLEHTESILAGIGLKLKEEKTAIRNIKEGFTFLGINFSTSEIVVDPEEEFRRLKKPLYITQPYLFLSLNGDALDIVNQETTVETVPLRRVSEIMLMEKAVLSTAVVRKCVDMNIPISIALNTGYYVTTIKPDSRDFYSISHAHATKFDALPDTEFLIYAKEFAAGKLKNYASLFQTAQKNLPDERVAGFIMELGEIVKRVYSAGDIDQTRGFEGSAAKKVYAHINILINDEQFHIKKREREKTDRINSMLNFGYYLLFSKVNATVRALGLNPYLGFLHSAENNYESLVCDIEELFRARIDWTIIKMINLKIIKKDDFEEKETGLRLTRDGIKKYINYFEGEMEKKKDNTKLSLKEEIYLQCLIVKKWAMNEWNLTFHKWTP